MEQFLLKLVGFEFVQELPKMNKRLTKAFRLLLALVAVIAVSIFLTGCPEGGGGSGTGVPPVYVDPIHTVYNLQPAQIYSTGTSYWASAQVKETRGDEISISLMKTYRTLTTRSTNSTNPHAETYYDTEASSNYYSGNPMQANYAMFIPGTPGIILDDTTSPTYTFGVLKGYGTRTIKIQVMVGREYESRPASFNGLFISYNEYHNWVMSGKIGIKYWIRLEGYDAKLRDSYNIHIPLEIYFVGSMLPTTGTNPYPDSGNTDTNPFDPTNDNGYDIGDTNPY